MTNLIWGIIGLIIALIAAFFLIKLMRLNKHGIVALAEVTDVKEKKHRTIVLFSIVVKTAKKTDSFIHTLRYKIGDKIFETDDKAGYVQPFEVGSTHLIVCDPENPEKFEYESDLKRNMTLFAVMIAVAVVFSAKWIFFNK